MVNSQQERFPQISTLFFMEFSKKNSIHLPLVTSINSIYSVFIWICSAKEKTDFRSIQLLEWLLAIDCLWKLEDREATTVEGVIVNVGGRKRCLMKNTRCVLEKKILTIRYWIAYFHILLIFFFFFKRINYVINHWEPYSTKGSHVILNFCSV